MLFILQKMITATKRKRKKKVEAMKERISISGTL